MKLTSEQLRRLIREELTSDIIVEATKEEAEKAIADWPTSWGQIVNPTVRAVAQTALKKGRYDDVIRLASDTSGGDHITAKTLVNAFDWMLLAGGFAADFVPGPGTLISTALGAGNIASSMAQKNWLGVVLGAVAITLPAVGDAIAIVGKAIQGGMSIPIPLLRKVSSGLARVSDEVIQEFVTEKATELGIEVSDEAKQGMSKSLTQFKNDVSSLLEKQAPRAQV